MSFIKSLADVIPGLGKLTFDNNAGKILVTSGTGVVGYRVALGLLEAGQDVRVGIWQDDRQGISHDFVDVVAEKLRAKGAQVIDFDWNKDIDFFVALEGVQTVFCTMPYLPHWPECFANFLRMCKTKKVEHFVKLSFLRPTHAFEGVAEMARLYRDNVPFLSFHGTCDDILEQAKTDSRISYTILCASHLMATPLLTQGRLLRDEHKYVTASYGMGINYVSPNDVAEAAIIVLLDQGPHRNKVYNLTGAKPITDAQVAQVLSRHYGTHIEHVELGFHAYAKNVRKRGLPDWQVRDAANTERMKAQGLEEKRNCYTDDLFQITGRQPESFDDYMLNRSLMRPGLAFP